MGMNYYAQFNRCGHCGRVDKIHIGKKSSGWQFIWHAIPEESLLSFAEWRSMLGSHDGLIFNEDGEEVSLDEFLGMAMSKVGKSHAGAYEDGYLDEDGMSFVFGEFS